MTEREPQPFSEEEKAAIGELFKRRKNRFDVAEAEQLLADISRKFGRINLGEIHDLLREQGSKTYFIARPTGESSLYVSQWPHSGDKKYKYRLYVCTGGERQYTHWLKTENVTHEENIKRLKETGLFMPKPGTERARMVRAALN